MDIFEEFGNAVKTILEEKDTNKYYVYRLVDPRTLQTFYVGKGCGERVLQHAKCVQKLLNNKENNKSDNDDELSLKSQQIAEIIASGKQVIAIIHRYGLTEEEAFEVEAALIDAYPGLTNIQKGQDYERGAISVEDLCQQAQTKVYVEPDIDYIIIKTTLNEIGNRGNIYDAVRQSWVADLNKARNYKYVLAVVSGFVREVFIVDKWFTCPSGRIAFEGKQAPINDKMSSLKNMLIPKDYRKKGNANPFLYKKQSISSC